MGEHQKENHANRSDRKPKSLESNPDLLLHLICLQIEKQPSVISQRTSLITSSARPGGGIIHTSPIDLEIINRVTAASFHLLASVECLVFDALRGMWKVRSGLLHELWRSTDRCIQRNDADRYSDAMQNSNVIMTFALRLFSAGEIF